MSAKRLTIEGRVQGVGYRWWAVDEARRLGLRGWVRNRRDGVVELLAIGETGALDKLIAACRRGPAGAQVTAVTAAEAEDDGSPDFRKETTL